MGPPLALTASAVQQKNWAANLAANKSIKYTHYARPRRPKRCYLFDLPNELIDLIFDFIQPNYAKIAASATCKRLNGYRPLSITDEDCFMYASLLSFHKSIKLEHRCPGVAACGACFKVHPYSAFAPKMLKRAPHLRRCRGRDCLLPLTDTKSIDYDQVRKLICTLTEPVSMRLVQYFPTIGLITLTNHDPLHWILRRVLYIRSNRAHVFGAGANGHVFQGFSVKACAHFTINASTVRTSCDMASKVSANDPSQTVAACKHLSATVPIPLINHEVIERCQTPYCNTTIHLSYTKKHAFDGWVIRGSVYNDLGPLDDPTDPRWTVPLLVPHAKDNIVHRPSDMLAIRGYGTLNGRGENEGEVLCSEVLDETLRAEAPLALGERHDLHISPRP